MRRPCALSIWYGCDTALWLLRAALSCFFSLAREVVHPCLHLRRTRDLSTQSGLSSRVHVPGVRLTARLPKNPVYCSSTMAVLKLCAETLHLHWASGTGLLLSDAK